MFLLSAISKTPAAPSTANADKKTPSRLLSGLNDDSGFFSLRKTSSAATTSTSSSGIPFSSSSLNVSAKVSDEHPYTSLEFHGSFEDASVFDSDEFHLDEARDSFAGDRSGIPSNSGKVPRRVMTVPASKTTHGRHHNHQLSKIDEIGNRYGCDQCHPLLAQNHKLVTEVRTLESCVHRLESQLKKKTHECDELLVEKLTLSTAHTRILSETEELSQSLFEEANKMVSQEREANVALKLENERLRNQVALLLMERK